MKRFNLLACAILGFLGPATSAPAKDPKATDEAIKKDLEALQGRWERVMTTDTSLLGKAKRAVREVKGDQETVTWYGDKDQVIRSHRVTFHLSESGKVRVFTWTDMEVLEGLGKGLKPPLTGSDVYRLNSGVLYEASGFVDGAGYVEFAKWKKAEEKK
jgi:hypothetical protein